MEDATLQPSVLEKPPKKPKFLTFFIISILIIVAIFIGFRFFGSKTDKSEDLTITPTPTEFQLPTESPIPEVTSTTKPTVSPTSKPTVTPTSGPTINPVDKQSGLDRSKLSIEVQNGSGVTGAAKKAGEFLKGLGYVITATVNADSEDYNDVSIQVKSGKSNFLSLLQKDLGSGYTVGTASADLTATSSADALVIVGK